MALKTNAALTMLGYHFEILFDIISVQFPVSNDPKIPPVGF